MTFAVSEIDKELLNTEIEIEFVNIGKDSAVNIKSIAAKANISEIITESNLQNNSLMKGETSIKIKIAFKMYIDNVIDVFTRYDDLNGNPYYQKHRLVISYSDDMYDQRPSFKYYFTTKSEPSVCPVEKILIYDPE